MRKIWRVASRITAILRLALGPTLEPGWRRLWWTAATEAMPGPGYPNLTVVSCSRMGRDVRRAEGLEEGARRLGRTGVAGDRHPRHADRLELRDRGLVPVHLAVGS